MSESTIIIIVFSLFAKHDANNIIIIKMSDSSSHIKGMQSYFVTLTTAVGVRTVLHV